MTRLAVLLVAIALAAAYRQLRGRRAVVVAYRESDDGIQPPDPGLRTYVFGFGDDGEYRVVDVRVNSW